MQVLPATAFFVQKKRPQCEDKPRTAALTGSATPPSSCKSGDARIGLASSRYGRGLQIGITVMGSGSRPDAAPPFKTRNETPTRRRHAALRNVSASSSWPPFVIGQERCCAGVNATPTGLLRMFTTTPLLRRSCPDHRPRCSGYQGHLEALIFARHGEKSAMGVSVSTGRDLHF